MKSIILSANKRFNTVDGPVLILIIMVVLNVYSIRMNQYQCGWTLMVSHYHSHLSDKFSQSIFALGFQDFCCSADQNSVMVNTVGFYCYCNELALTSLLRVYINNFSWFSIHSIGSTLEKTSSSKPFSLND